MKDWKKTWKLLKKKLQYFNLSLNEFLKKINRDPLYKEMIAMVEHQFTAYEKYGNGSILVEKEKVKTVMVHGNAQEETLSGIKLPTDEMTFVMIDKTAYTFTKVNPDGVEQWNISDKDKKEMQDWLEDK